MPGTEYRLEWVVSPRKGDADGRDGCEERHDEGRILQTQPISHESERYGVRNQVGGKNCHDKDDHPRRKLSGEPDAGATAACAIRPPQTDRGAAINPIQ